MAPIVIDPMIGARTVASADRSQLNGVSGEPVADVGLAPRLLAQSAVAELRADADGVPPDPAIFARAAALFATENLAGASPNDYALNVIRSSGLTMSAVRRSVEEIVAQLTELPETTAAELPRTEFGNGFRTRWVPRGRLFAAVLASNHPAPNASWVQALFHGYSVLVRPGSRDPFTPLRLIAALTAAGLPAGKIAFLPSSHAVGEFLLGQADRGIVYGGESAVTRWRARESVAVRGPGRAKALLDADIDDTVLDHLAYSASFDGGARCNNLSAVLTSRPVAQVADGLALRLRKLPVLPATDPAADLLFLERGRAQRLQRLIDSMRAELTDHSGGDSMVELDDGSVVPQPIVLSAPTASHPLVGTELPFPFVVVAPWTAADGIAPLRDSLVLNLITDRAELVSRALREPSVRKVVRGTVLPWATVPGIPHDDNFTQFLLEPKGCIGDSAE